MSKGKRVEVKSGDRYGRLTIIEELQPHICCPSGQKMRRVKCRCDCGNTTIVLLNELRRGNTVSCGCHRKQMVSEVNSKTNEYDLSGEIGIGYTSKGERFLFDKEDYWLIKDYCWFISNRGYVEAAVRATSKHILFHRLIMNAVNKDEVVDHINHDTTNNCKSNLRICNQWDNMKNMSIKKNNTSGVSGVTWNKQRKKWQATIMVNRKNIYLGYFTDINEAAKARIKAEIEFYKEYAPAYNYFTEEQRQSILDDTMPSEEIVEILKLNQYIEQCI